MGSMNSNNKSIPIKEKQGKWLIDRYTAIWLKFPQHIPLGDIELTNRLLQAYADRIYTTSSASYSRSRKLFPTEIMLDVWRAWKQVDFIDVGKPATLCVATVSKGLHGTEEETPELELTLLPEYCLAPGRSIHFDLLHDQPLRLFLVRMDNGLWKVDPEQFCQEFQIPNIDKSVWEASLAMGFMLIKNGIPAETVDDLYFGASDNWRRFYHPESGRVLRTDNGKAASIWDEWCRMDVAEK